MSLETAMLLFDRLVMTDPGRSLEMARELTAALLPSPALAAPQPEVAWRSLPADEVGGDFYDLLPGPDGAVYVVVGDVSGAGALTALFVTMTTCLLRILAQDAVSPGAMLAQANRILQPHLSRRCMLITAQVACYEAKSSELVIASAGHMWPFFMMKEQYAEVPLSGLPLGALAAGGFPEHRTRVEAGSRLVLYTDGLVECTDRDGQIFGFERLAGALGNGSASQIVGALVERFDRFVEGVQRRDDVSVVALAWS